MTASLVGITGILVFCEGYFWGLGDEGMVVVVRSLVGGAWLCAESCWYWVIGIYVPGLVVVGWLVRLFCNVDDRCFAVGINLEIEDWLVLLKFLHS